MPYRPQRSCSKQGCPNLTYNMAGYCHEHQSGYRKEQDALRPSSNERGYDYRWHKARTRYLRENPLCVECLKVDRVVEAAEVHHIKPIVKGGNHADSNLMALCKSCHSKITAQSTFRN